MPKLTFYPLGNADCCLIDLKNGKKLLFDFANMRDPNNKDDLRCDLPKELSEDLEAADRKNYDVVAFTHLDNDHIKGSTEFFWLEHDKKYQSDERIRIDVLWVPAALITEDELDDEEAKILQKEARHRFMEGEEDPRLLAAPTAQGLVREEQRRLRGAEGPGHRRRLVRRNSRS